MVDSVLVLMDEAVTNEQFDTAKQLGATATDLARKSKDSELVKETVGRTGTITKEITEIQKAQANVEDAVATLDKNPTDMAANLAVGKFRCFMKNLWSKGIPMLALGEDPALRDLAVKELKGVTDAAGKAKLGDAWWETGEKKAGVAKRNILAHATSWYEQAVPDMAPGLAKLKVEKRIAQAAEEPVPVAKTGALTAKDPWISKNATYRVSSVHFIFRPLPGLLTGAEGDGNLHNTDQFAFHTEEEKTPFIVIDLQKEYRITGIVILNRRDATARAAGLKVWLSTDPNSRGARYGTRRKLRPNGRCQ